MKFLRRLSSCRFLRAKGKLSTVIKLLLRLRMRRFLRPLRFSILRILLSLRSSTSKFGSYSSRFSIVSMKFLLRISTLRCWKVGIFEISESRFCDRSKKVRLGRLTMFSILVISFYDKLSYFNFSSPSSKGTCFNALFSSDSFSVLEVRSEGLR